MDWFREQVQLQLKFQLPEPKADFDAGARHLHYGWWQQPLTSGDKLWSYGTFIENGRISDSDSNGRLKTAIRELLAKYSVELTITPNQDLLFSNIADAVKENFLHDLESYGYGQRNGKAYSQLRLLSGACVGRDTCRLAYTDSEKFEPFLLDELESMGWGDIATSIGVTGCERQCYRPATKAIGLVGSGLNLYQLKLMGTEDGRHQGGPVFSHDGEHTFLRCIPRERVSVVIDALFRYYTEHKQADEEVGYFHRRVGLPAIIKRLQDDAKTADLMAKEYGAENILLPTSS